MSRRHVIAVILALIVAAVCVRLGIWQLDRLGERRARNAQVAARANAAPVMLTEIPADAVPERFRRVRAEGTFDFEHELVLTGRTREGSPGVHIITPLRLDGSGRAVWVNRGWVYAPDAASVDLSRWREPARATIEGYSEHFPADQAQPARSESNPRAWRRLDASEIADVVPYPIAPFYLVALSSHRAGDGDILESGPQANVPARLTLPALDEGPHKGYAIQWFAFAAIALVGVSVLIWQDRTAQRRRRDPVTDTAVRASSQR